MAFQTQAEPDSFNHRGWGEVVTHLQKLGFGFREPSKVSNCPVFGSGQRASSWVPKRPILRICSICTRECSPQVLSDLRGRHNTGFQPLGWTIMPLPWEWLRLRDLFTKGAGPLGGLAPIHTDTTHSPKRE